MEVRRHTYPNLFYFLCAKGPFYVGPSACFPVLFSREECSHLGPKPSSCSLLFQALPQQTNALPSCANTPIYV